MPGLSLWLVPPQSKPFVSTLQELISETIPSLFTAKTHAFIPHITVTSDIPSSLISSASSPQSWVDTLPLDTLSFQKEKNEVILELDHLEAEDPFFRKLNIALSSPFNANLKSLVALCRKEAGLEGETFAEKEYRPHLSLVYADMPTKDASDKLALVEMKIGFALGDLFACCGGALCMGGELVLVDTTKEIEGWEIVGRREVPWTVWRAAKSLC